MCEELSSEDILLNYFSLNEDKDKISLSDLGELSLRIAKDCGLSVIVKSSYQDVAEALLHNHELITLQGENIERRSQGPLKLSNSGISPQVRQVLREVLSVKVS